MKARIDFFCQSRKKSETDILENIHIYVELSIKPNIGWSLKATPTADYIEIKDIMLDETPGGEGLVIGLAEPEGTELRSWAQMKKDGWKLSQDG